MLKGAYDIRQTPDRSWENTHNMIKMSRRIINMGIKQMCLQTALQSNNGLGTLDGERDPEGRGGMRKTKL